MKERKLVGRWPRCPSPEDRRGRGREGLARRSKRHGHDQDDDVHGPHRGNEEHFSKKVSHGRVCSDHNELERRVSERVLDPATNPHGFSKSSI